MSVLDRKVSLDKLINLLIGHQWLQGISLYLLIIIFNLPILTFMKKYWISLQKMARSLIPLAGKNVPANAQEKCIFDMIWYGHTATAKTGLELSPDPHCRKHWNLLISYVFTDLSARRCVRLLNHRYF